MVLGNDIPHGVIQILAGLLNDSGHSQDIILGEDMVLCTDIDRLTERVLRCLPFQMEHEVAQVVTDSICNAVFSVHEQGLYEASQLWSILLLSPFVVVFRRAA